MSRSLSMTELAVDATRLRRIARIRDLSRAMAALCLATAVLLGVAMLAYWVVTPADTLLAQAGVPFGVAGAPGLLLRGLGFAISMIPLGALVYGLLRARRCFGFFAAGWLFTAHTGRELRAFALSIAAAALLKPFAGAALTVLLSWSAPPGMKVLAFSVGSDTLVALIFAGLVAVIAWVMTDAMAIADENAQFV